MADENLTDFTAEETAATQPEPRQPAVPEADVSREAIPDTPAESTDGDGKTLAKPDAMVPSSRLREETERRRASEQRYQRDMGKLEERLNLLQRAVTPADQPKAPDWDTAPLDAGKRLEADVRQILQRDAHRDQMESFRNSYAAHAQNFAREHQDFGQAYHHFIQSIAGELQDAGWTDPGVVAQEIQRMEAAIASKAMRDGVNPAERIYAVAKRRGYQATNGAQQPGAGDGKQHVETLQRGQQAAASTARAGNAPPANLTLNKLLEMDDHDFAEIATNPRKWRQIMGG